MTINPMSFHLSADKIFPRDVSIFPLASVGIYQLVTTQNQKEKAEEEELILDNTKIPLETGPSIVDSEKNAGENEKTSSDDTSKKSHGSLTWKILKLNSPEWFWILLGSISSLLVGATQPLFALFLTRIFALFAEPNLDEQKRLTNIYAIAIFLTGLDGAAAQFFIGVTFAKSGEELTMRMRKLTFSAILRQEIGYFDSETNSVGALITRLSSDTSSLQGMTGVRIGIMLQVLSATITVLAIAFSAGWKLTLVIICFIPLMLLTGIFQGRKQSNIAKAKNKSSLTEQGGQYVAQAIEHIRTVAGLHLEKYFIDRYENIFNQEFKEQMCRMHLMGISAGITNSAVYFLYMTNFAYGNKLVQNGEMEFDQVVRVPVAIAFAMVSVGRSMAMIFDYSKARKAALKIIRLDQRQSKINPHDESGTILNDVRGDVEFEHVDFQYPSRPNLRILTNLSLKCSNGQTTALVGPSGSGKSTTIGLLQRFYDPLNGKILLDGYDIKHLNLRWLRSLMGFVQQEPTLFNLPIRDNIAYGDDTNQITQDQIEAAAQMANIHQFIISLPKGYETLCGAKGNQLSGGQKQRIAIARALVRQPKILLLDEATSSLDTNSEKIVQAALDKPRSVRTCLTIAHRLSTIQNSEKIAVVHRGKIKEEGTHDQLFKLNGIYTKLVLTQDKST